MGKPFYIDKIPNYRRFVRRLRTILDKSADGHDVLVLGWEMRAPKNGFRFVTVRIKDRPSIQFYQPWEGDSI